MATKLRKYLKNIPKTLNCKQLTYPRYEHTGDVKEAISNGYYPYHVGEFFYCFHSFWGGGKLMMIAAEYNTKYKLSTKKELDFGS